MKKNTGNSTSKRQQTAGIKSPFPIAVSPMLCTLLRNVYESDEYIHEVKWDGYRIIAYQHKNKVRLSSRNGLNYTNKYPAILTALKKIKHDVVLDGELCVLNERGSADFYGLQKYGQQGGELVYYVFDVLWKDGYSLMQVPLLERKHLLQQLLKDNITIRYSEYFTDGIGLFNQVKALQLEGIVSKRKDSVYRPGKRGHEWYKTPAERRQEFVIGGWTESDKPGRDFRSLLFGAYNGKHLEWIGHSGGGFKDRDMPVILKKLKQLETAKNPFTNKVAYTGKVHWIKPRLVADFKFAEFTASGRIRKPAIFLGFRTDKNPKQVVREVPLESK